MNPNRYDLWDVSSAAGKLIGQALSVSARHLASGTLRMQFNREVAYYAKQIADDVALGHTPPERGIQTIVQEQRDLLSQSRALAHKGQGAITHRVERIPLNELTRVVLRRDPERLLRFVHAQNLKTSTNTEVTTRASAPQSPFDPFAFFPREQWPKPIQVNEPGFYVVPKSTTAATLEAQLFTAPNPVVIAKFRALNPNLNQVKAGQMIVLSDPNNLQCTREDAQLMTAAEKVNAALQPLTPDEADFMVRHHDEILSFLTQGSTSIGVGEAIFARNLESVKGSLRDIESLHQRTFQRDGHLRSPEFFAERKRLFSQLDTHLTGLTKKGIGFPDHPNLKSALGISSRSLVHRWTKAGAPDQIPGYATHMDGVARAAKYVKYGGWLGTAVGGGASYMKVQDVCTAGDVEACERIKFTESGSFIGGLAGGALAGGVLSGAAAGTICLGLSVPTGGAAMVICGLVVVGAGSYGVGAAGGAIGEWSGEIIYESTK